jgi:AAA+ ATPase superfamily predicted ATPase
MTWEEFVHQWASQDIEVPSLLLSESLDDEEVEAVLAVLPTHGIRWNIVDGAKNIKVSKRTMDNRLEKVYVKCTLWEGKNRYLVIGNKLSDFFDANYVAVASAESFAVSLFSSENSLESPEGVVPIGSRFYMEPTSALERCKEAITQPTSFLRIQAPRQRGKTSLLERIIEHAKKINYRVVKIDLGGADHATLESLNSLLQWLCRQVCKRLDLNIVLSEYWDEEDDSKGACTTFFEEYFLNDDRPLLLSLDNLESIFSNFKVGADFCGLLRSWKEEESRDWQNIKVILIHTWYVSTADNFSPLDNIRATLVNLPELTINQVTELVKLYDLTCNEKQIDLLVNLVGFHPFLIRFALDHISRKETSLEDILARGHLSNGLFEEHLTRHLRYLERSPQLYEIVQKVLQGEHPLIVRSDLLKQLRDSGITKSDGNREFFLNRLYELFFRRTILIKT